MKFLKFALLFLVIAFTANSALADLWDTDCPKNPYHDPNPNRGWEELSRAQQKKRLKYDEAQEKFMDCVRKEDNARIIRYNTALFEVANQESAAHIEQAKINSAPDLTKRIAEFEAQAKEYRRQGRKEYSDSEEGIQADILWLDQCQKENVEHPCYTKFYRALKETKIVDESKGGSLCRYSSDPVCSNLFMELKNYLSFWGPRLTCNIGGTEVNLRAAPSSSSSVQNIGMIQYTFRYSRQTGLEITAVRAPTQQEEKQICEEGKRKGNPNTCYVGHSMPVDQETVEFDKDGLAVSSLGDYSAYCIRDPHGPYFSLFE